uniref:HECT-type E3 ubiquitin transferase n=1 Tax=Arcella intermedia TaxID=1963864 RepID=A0A6B2LPZ2_9EUKA
MMMVVSYDWLRFFNSYELGLLISGNKSKIDLDDLRQHTKYSNGYHDSHRTILMFWQAMYELPQEHLASFLKFVTSCSKAPLLGFKELSPPFCVHKSSIGYMPSATTCVNQFKLPPYEDYQTLKEKLLYAITSNSGFELS